MARIPHPSHLPRHDHNLSSKVPRRDCQNSTARPIETHSAAANVSVTGTYKSKSGEILVVQTATDRIEFSLFSTYNTNTGGAFGRGAAEQEQSNVL